MFYNTNQSYHWKLNQSEFAISGRLANQIVRIKPIRRGVTSFTSPSEQYIQWHNRHWHSVFLTDHDHVHLREMRQRIYKKRSLLRHMKTHVDSSHTYSSGICDKVFSRPDHRKRHEAAHSYSFNRMDSLARHRAQHERPETKQRLQMKRPVAPESGPSPKHRRTVLLPKTPMGNPVGPDVLPKDPETRALYRQHW